MRLSFSCYFFSFMHTSLICDDQLFCFCAPFIALYFFWLHAFISKFCNISYSVLCLGIIWYLFLITPSFFLVSFSFGCFRLLMLPKLPSLESKCSALFYSKKIGIKFGTDPMITSLSYLIPRIVIRILSSPRRYILVENST